jgi:hypothetical protein
MMEAVHRYEGTVNQVMGDGIMALFGAPLAHEDHAVRACYAALRMPESVKKYAEEVRRSHAAVVKIRVGLNSGEVVVRAIGSDLRMHYMAVGQTTHLAARMEQIADPGAIVITPDTLALAEGYVEVKSLGPVPVKGLAEAMEVYEVTGAGPARTRLQAGARRGLTQFVGRDAELEQLRRAQQPAEDGHGQVVAVMGEAGVGKSRLVYELTHSHRLQGWLTLESASVSYGKATTYLPVIDLLKVYFKIQDGDDLLRDHLCIRPSDVVLGQATHFVQDLNQPLHAAWGETRAEHNEIETQMLYRSWQKNHTYRGFIHVKNYSCFAHEIAQNSSQHARALFLDPEIKRVTQIAWDQAVNDTANLWQAIFLHALGRERSRQLYGIPAPVSETRHRSLC